jgi:hypothetical protein
MNNDVMVIAKRGIIEVEVKLSRSDLWTGEEKKDKHKRYKQNIEYGSCNWYIPNFFYIGVPPELNEDAFKWVNSVNERYGVIVCKEREFIPYELIFYKHAELLKSNFDIEMKEKIMKRVCSENIGLIEQVLLRNR